MPTFTGKAFANFYKNILGINQTGNTGVDTTTRNVQDGAGNNTSISLSDDVVQVQPITDDTTSAFSVKDKGGNGILSVDTTNSAVKSGLSQVNSLTLFKEMGLYDFSPTAGYHYPLTFSASSFYSSVVVPFGNGTDPATTFTTAEASAERASDLVPLIWYVSDNITIDEIKHLEGADTATGDTTRMHLLSYTFNSGSTSCLTSGAVVANTIFDNTNAGSEQPYLRDWGILTADIDAGKVLLCFFESDTVNSDYAIQVTIKYHLR